MTDEERLELLSLLVGKVDEPAIIVGMEGDGSFENIQIGLPRPEGGLTTRRPSPRVRSLLFKYLEL